MKEKWMAMSDESLQAARLLFDHGLFRSAVSRAYYAVYCALAGELCVLKGIHFSFGGTNPSHDSLSILVRGLDSRRFSFAWKKKVLSSLIRLRRERIIADYGVTASFTRENSLRCTLVAAQTVRLIRTGKADR